VSKCRDTKRSIARAPLNSNGHVNDTWGGIAALADGRRIKCLTMGDERRSGYTETPPRQGVS